MHSRPGLAWVRTSRFPAIKFKTCLALSRSMRLLQRWEWIPAQASHFLAEYLPKIVDKLTPTGKVDPNADHQQGLAALLPSLLQSLRGEAPGGQSAQP